MLASAFMRVAESGVISERRSTVMHFVTVLLECESALGNNPPQSEDGCRKLVKHAIRIADAVDEQLAKERTH
jgi:hypothetical protein